MYLSLNSAQLSSNKWVFSKTRDVLCDKILLKLLPHEHVMFSRHLHGKFLMSLLVSDKVNGTAQKYGINLHMHETVEG